MLEMRVIPGHTDYMITETGDVWSSRWKRYLKIVEINGYAAVCLGQKVLPQYIHRLLLTTFVRPPKPKEVGRHLNDIKTDNKLSNLAWGTQKENLADAKKNGNPCGCKKGNRSSHARFTDAEVVEIRRKFKMGGITQIELGDEYNVSHATISLIVCGKTYKDLL